MIVLYGIAQLSCWLPDFSFFESSSITLQLSCSKISFNIYCPPSISPVSKPNSVFLVDFNSFLSFTATTPHGFMITGDFNIHLDNPTDHLTSVSLSSPPLTLLNMLTFLPTTKITFSTWSSPPLTAHLPHLSLPPTALHLIISLFSPDFL